MSEAPIRNVSVRGFRATIADKLTTGLREAAQLTHHPHADLTALHARRATLLAAGTRVSVEDLIIDALLTTLARQKALNGTITERTIWLAEAIDLSVGVALPGNLLDTPTVLDAGSLSLGRFSVGRAFSSRRKRREMP